MRRIIVDLDHTICTPRRGEDQSLEANAKYTGATPNLPVIEAIRQYRSDGFEIVIFTARNMRTYDGDVDAINRRTLPIIMDWLKENEVPFDDVIVGKPWCGTEGFYVDDRAVRPSEFAALSFDAISLLLDRERKSDG